MTNSGPARHLLLGGSSASRWANCTASVAFCADIAKPVTPSMLKGTDIHGHAEIGLTGLLLRKLKGTNANLAFNEHLQTMLAAYERGESNFQSKSDIYDAHNMAQAYRDFIWKEVLNESIADKAFGVEGEFVLSEELGIGGTADFWDYFINDRGLRVLDIVDLKTGYYSVDIEKNHQLVEYGLAARKTFLDNGRGVDLLRTWIFQPNAPDATEEGFKMTSYTAKQLDAWQQRLEKAAHKIVVTKKTSFKAGKWCEYCPGKNVCRKYVEDLTRKTDLVLINPKKIKFPPAETLPKKTLAGLVEHGEEVIKYIRDCKKYVMGLCLSGVGFDGYKVVKGRTRRKWIANEEKIVQGLKKLKVKEPFVYKLKPFTQVEKELRPDQRKKLSKYLTKGPAKLHLAPEDDPRPKVGDAEGFLGLEEFNEDE